MQVGKHSNKNGARSRGNERGGIVIRNTSLYIYIYIRTGKGAPITGHEGPEGE